MDIIRCIDNFSVVAFPLLVIAALVAWGAGLHSYYKKMRETDISKKLFYKKRFLTCWVFFMCFIGFIFAINSVVKFYAQKEVTFLLAQKIESVQINGAIFENSVFTQDIKHIAFSPAYHHSHPTHGVNVVLHTIQGDLELTLARDSSDAHEYWVFYKKFHVTSMNDIGKISSTTLDEF